MKPLNTKNFYRSKKTFILTLYRLSFLTQLPVHKSQGGQWDTVFVEQPYLPNGIDKDYLRWLYTAITRAKKKLYLIGFKDDFFRSLNQILLNKSVFTQIIFIFLNKF